MGKIPERDCNAKERIIRIIRETRNPLVLHDERSAAKYLGGADHPLSVKTLQSWRLTGRGPAYLKVGGAIRYPQAALNEFLIDRLRQSTSTGECQETV